ncbi:MAG: hypothetical protein EPN73_17890 [Paraburkholderia sp.]|uniref:hypothetical protein n=1 Tax=Paraburkholderia sp. TaxID=1926495 RepID=UPI00120461F7|nr:hypothetical protein [Paraburkholderia sp.]TAL94233.1 MAG: hypothetical protein EPN73_17890 [Paraburkholderia sp.]
MTYRRFLILLLVPLSVRASAQKGFSRNVVVSLGMKTYNFYCEGTPGSPSVNITLQEVPVGVTASNLAICMPFGPRKGTCTLTTFRLENDGRCTQVGEPQVAQEYEYDLYRLATRLNAKYTDGSCAKEVQSALDINKEADAYSFFSDLILANVCGNYDYHSRSCMGSFSTSPFKNSSQFERVARAVNTGATNSTGTVNGLVPRANVFPTTIQTLTDTIFSDIGVVAQRE